MKQKHNMVVYSCIWIVAILLLVFSLAQNFGIAKVINYSGIVRGATQKLIKEEIYNQPNDNLIAYLDGILNNLRTGEGEYGLVSLDDDAYHQELDEMYQTWEIMKTEITNVRAGQSKDELYRLSEDYFIKADHMVATAQEYSDAKLRYSIITFVAYLVVTIGFFMLWHKYKQRQINNAMYIDELTGVNNFSGFEIELEAKLSKANDSTALLCLDIDGFKYMNSIYGSKIGDQLLKVIAWTLQVFVGEKGCLARYGSDEFYILCEYHKETITQLKKAINENVQKTIELDIYKDLTVCIGVYLIQKGDDISNMIDNANLAHKHAKKLGKGGFLCYNQELLDQLYYESKLAKNMHTALTNHEFKLYLQPKFQIPTLKVVGAEALVRWQEADGNILFPDEFIPSFEQNGFIYELDFYMLEQVCQFIDAHDLVNTEFKISVNFSRVTIHHQDFCGNLDRIMTKYNIPPQAIELEITETTFNEFSPHIIFMLNQLCAKGYVFSMDDFGAGFSSLNSIHSIPVDIIKIDRAFLAESHENESVISIMRLIVEMAHLLNKTIICEGVEQIHDVELLNDMGCYLGQGYYISKPIEQKEFVEKYLKE